MGGTRRTRMAIAAVGIAAALAIGGGSAGQAAPSVCTITGTPGNDTLNGTGGDDVLCGLGGNDTLDGGGGDDILLGGPGSDTLRGGAGRDTASFEGSTAPVTVDLTAGTASGEGGDTLSDVEGVIGSPQADSITGDAGANTLDGGGGDDTIMGGAPPRTGDVVYDSTRDGPKNFNVFTKPPCRTCSPDALTSNPTNDFAPAWSPDGRRIAFTSRRSGNYDLYVINADGSGVRRLTTDPGFDGFPSWSPDGTRIAFESSRTGGNYDIWIINADPPASPRRVTSDPAVDGLPTWSPDARRIAFDSKRDGDWEIYITARGGKVSRVTSNTVSDVQPSWSPDGRQLAFVHNHGLPGVYVRRLSTGIARLLAGGPAYQPSFSPDGRSVIFAWQQQSLELASMASTDGSGKASLTANAFQDELGRFARDCAGRCNSDGGDDLIGGRGNDILLGSAGPDTLSGGDGNDRLFGGDGGADTLHGGAGNDSLSVHDGAGGDSDDGGSGDDWCEVDTGEPRTACEG